MAKRAKGKGKYSEALKALEAAGVPKAEMGKVNNDGTITIDSKALEGLKKKVGKAAATKVRFVALNAPFKRRSPISPA